MFDRIGQCAEAVATSAGQTRRGFLDQLGKAALGAAGLVGGLLLFSSEARAYPPGCGYCCPDHTIVRTGCPCTRLTIKHKGMTCDRCISDCG
jgi:hypothetical protein